MNDFDLPVEIVGPAMHVHVVAVGGAAMSGIARYLRALGHTVTGSDVRHSATLDRLRDEGIDAVVGHRAENLGADVAVVVHSTAVRDDNPELVEARRRGLRVLHRSAMMAAIAETRPSVAVVSGTHGKTTTTSLLATMLDRAGRSPSFFIGGTATDLGTNARYDATGDWLVVEGDESDRSFLAFRRDLALVTNIEADHLEHWDGRLERLVEGFEEFVDAAARIVVCADDQGSAALADHCAAGGSTRGTLTTYGSAVTADYRLLSYRPGRTGATIEATTPTGECVEVTLRLRGIDMATNALGAATAAHLLGVPWGTAWSTAADFAGVGRRFEPKGEIAGADYFDDYAHTATEIATTLARAREGGWDRVVAVCQPHRYTRISRHHLEYADAFVDADVVVVTGLDPAFETPIAGVSSQLVVDAVLAAHPDCTLVHLPEWEALRDIPWSIARPGDVVVTLGCGTITDAHALWASEARTRDAERG